MSRRHSYEDELEMLNLSRNNNYYCTKIPTRWLAIALSSLELIVHFALFVCLLVNLNRKSVNLGQLAATASALFFLVTACITFGIFFYSLYTLRADFAYFCPYLAHISLVILFCFTWIVIVIYAASTRKLTACSELYGNTTTNCDEISIFDSGYSILALISFLIFNVWLFSVVKMVRKQLVELGRLLIESEKNETSKRLLALRQQIDPRLKFFVITEDKGCSSGGANAAVDRATFDASSIDHENLSVNLSTMMFVPKGSSMCFFRENETDSLRPNYSISNLSRKTCDEQATAM
uniref:MARVEL domain-containing protein n=1 Tax=Romanomermis culicivorax TaxID=13658 RepID=A0A915IZT6_ROMCU